MTAQKGTVAVVGTGDMGHAVGGALVRAGYRVVTAGAGRSALSQQLAAKSGIEDVGSLEAVMRSAQLVMSIVPPAAAPSFAASAARAMQAAGARPVFADCNAVAPATVAAIASAIAPTGAPFVDVGIVGRGPVPAASARVSTSRGKRARPCSASPSWSLRSSISARKLARHRR